jgi:AcrR family transcriptional regulator
MVPSKTPTRQRLIEAAIRRFYRDGFRSVGIDEILADVGISKTAFYKHFECKEDLMLAALEMQNTWLQNTFRDMIAQRGGPTAIGQLHATLDVVELITASDEFQGCIFVNVAMEFPLQHEPAHVLASQNKRAVEELLFTLAVRAKATEPRALAQELCLVMEGAYVTRHVTGDKTTIDIARRIAKQVIAAYCPPTTEKHGEKPRGPKRGKAKSSKPSAKAVD